jgi:hypothetical protein
MRITEQHQQSLLRHGHVIVPGFLKPDELEHARRGMLKYFPTDEELRATPQRYGSIFEDPEHLQVEFPFVDDALNDIATHPELAGFVERLLGTRDVLLSQSAIWAKYAGTGDFDQGLHLDYQGNTLVVPRDDGAFRDLPLWPTHRPRKKNPDLYRHERPVLAAAGDLLIFSMRTWHRASDMTAPTGARFSHHFVWRAAQHAFQGYHQWSRHGENPEMQRFIARATPRQREVLGFPPPGDAYWDEKTITAVQLRFPTMDMDPYRRQKT